eukprot:1182920-Prorocentrum_minimum.AAC.3
MSSKWAETVLPGQVAPLPARHLVSPRTAAECGSSSRRSRRGSPWTPAAPGRGIRSQRNKIRVLWTPCGPPVETPCGPPVETPCGDPLWTPCGPPVGCDHLQRPGVVFGERGIEYD